MALDPWTTGEGRDRAVADVEQSLRSYLPSPRALSRLVAAAAG